MISPYSAATAPALSSTLAVPASCGPSTAVDWPSYIEIGQLLNDQGTNRGTYITAVSRMGRTSHCLGLGSASDQQAE